jgi:hypothetical protein
MAVPSHQATSGVPVLPGRLIIKSDLNHPFIPGVAEVGLFLADKS